MPLSRVLLLHLCGLLLAVFAVTATHAAAPPYGSELEIIIGSTPSYKTRTEQANSCQTNGGALLPMVTDAVYLATVQQMDASKLNYVIGYMGGSTMLSSSECKVGVASLSCIWYWDQGRYEGAENATAFYKGSSSSQTGAGMVSDLVGNYWRTRGDANQRYPGASMQRYGMAVRYGGALGWADSSDTTWTYSNDVGAAADFVFCARETSTGAPPTPSMNPDTPRSTGLSVGAIVGIAVGAAALVVVVVVLILCLTFRCGCYCCGCCFAASPAMVPTASQGGGLSRTNSCRSCRSGFGDVGNRSFHDGAASKDGYSRRSSFYGGVEDAGTDAWQGGDHEMVSVSGSHYGRTASGANGSWAPPSRAPSQMMMPVPPHMMAMYGSGQACQTPMPVSIYATESPAAQMQRRSSNVSADMRNMSETDSIGESDER